MVTSSQRRKPLVVKSAQTAPDTAPDVDPDVEGQTDDENTAADESAAEDWHAQGGVGQHMDGSLDTPIPHITSYPSYPDPVPPNNAFVISDESKASAEWFAEDPNNDMLVYAKEDIVEKVFPANTVTPTYVQRVAKGTQMTKQAVNQLLGG